MSESKPASTLESPTTGLLLVVSSPSGAGKTTLARRLLGEFTDLRFSVSYTTRPQRGREQDGVDYHFVSEATFDQMIAAGAFAEWCLVHNRRYGTSVETLRTALCSGQHVLLDIDYQGAAKLREQLPRESRLVFILPPSLPILEQRLRSRGTDASSVIDQRLRKATEELQHYKLYDYLVINRELDDAYAELSAIYQVERDVAEGRKPAAEAFALAERCRREQRTQLAEQVLLGASEFGRSLS